MSVDAEDLVWRRRELAEGKKQKAENKRRFLRALCLLPTAFCF
jgi:hypothetical protein